MPLGRADGDLTEPGAAERLLDVHEPEAVVHLAAALPDDARFVGNAPMTALVASACAARDLPLFHGSTTSVYFDETPYAESKRVSEELVGDATILRFHFPYGPRQRNGAIPMMLRQALAGGPVTVFPGFARSFCYVDDTAEAVAILVEHGERGAFDVGRDDDLRPVDEVARLSCAAVGADGLLLEAAEPPAGYTPVVGSLDTERLRSLGWRPRVGLEEGIRRTLDWIREHG